MYKKLFVILLIINLTVFSLADDPVDDEIKEVKEATNPSSDLTQTTTVEPKHKVSYMCLIYCHCGCIEPNCCSGCKECTKAQLKDLFFSNMNANESTNLSDEITTTESS